MKILVTGGAGFIGSHIVDAYIEAGHDVAIVDNLYTGRRANLNPRARFHHCDVRDRRLWDVIEAERPNVVNHQAAFGNVRASVEDPVAFADVNVAGGANVLEACRRFGVTKVIYASTGGCVYGELETIPADETHRIAPRDPYGASKAAFELYLPVYAELYGLRFSILRYANIYGPRQDPLGEAGVVSIFIGQMLRGLPTVINGDGTQERDFVYVADVARASVLALDQGDRAAYNIGTGAGVTVNAIYDSLSRLTSYGRPRTHGPAKLGEVQRSCLDASRIAREMGWKPLVGLEEGLRRTVEHFRPVFGAER